jgi:hypothetical protein
MENRLNSFSKGTSEETFFAFNKGLKLTSDG